MNIIDILQEILIVLILILLVVSALTATSIIGWTILLVKVYHKELPTIKNNSKQN